MITCMNVTDKNKAVPTEHSPEVLEPAGLRSGNGEEECANTVLSYTVGEEVVVMI